MKKVKAKNVEIIDKAIKNNIKAQKKSSVKKSAPKEKVVKVAKKAAAKVKNGAKGKAGVKKVIKKKKEKTMEKSKSDKNISAKSLQLLHKVGAIFKDYSDSIMEITTVPHKGCFYILFIKLSKLTIVDASENNAFQPTEFKKNISAGMLHVAIIGEPTESFDEYERWLRMGAIHYKIKNADSFVEKILNGDL